MCWKHAGKQIAVMAVFVSVTVLTVYGTAHAQSLSEAPAAAGIAPCAVLLNGQAVQKSAEIESALVPFIVPVLLIGDGKCSATLSAADPRDGEILSIAAAGVCCGPYRVVDSNAALSDHSLTARVTVEQYGIVFFAGTLIAPESHFPKKLSLKLSF